MKSPVAQQIRHLLDRLVAFDTVSSKSNRDLINFVHDYLRRHGVEAELIANNDRSKANLLARLGTSEKAGIMFSGHTDVVPVEDQDWSTPPFEVRQRGDRLFGRGTADMKSFIAVVLAYVPVILARNLQSPVYIALSYDEEIGCVGVRSLIRFLRDKNISPSLAIIGEPTGLSIVTGHKGKLAYRVEVSGLEVHSAFAPHGVNAVEYAAELIVFIRNLARDLAEASNDAGYAVPHATMVTGTIRGGTALNVLPRSCAFEFEIRYLPQQDPDEIAGKVMAHARDILEPRMRCISPESKIKFVSLSRYPGLHTHRDDDAVSLMQEVIRTDACQKVDFGSEAGLFSEAGIPSVVFGPGYIAQAHKPDEYIDLEQIDAFSASMDRLIDRLGVS